MKVAKTTRRGANQRAQNTREQLVEAAVDVMRREGPAGLTTGKVTALAGIVQSGFYKHFRDLAECEQAAAEHVAERIRYIAAASQLRMRSSNPTDVVTLTTHFQALLEAVVAEREFVELFLRVRWDDSPIGGAMRRFITGLREDLSAHLWEMGRSYRLPDAARRPLERQADFALAAMIGAVEAAVMGRVKVDELPDAARQLAYNVMPSTQALFRELERTR